MGHQSHQGCLPFVDSLLLAWPLLSLRSLSLPRLYALLLLIAVFLFHSFPFLLAASLVIMLKTWFSLYGLAVAVQLAHVLANDPKHPASQHTEADAPTPTNLLKRSSSANQRSAGEGATIPERRPDSQEGQQPQSLSSSSNRQQHEARSAQRRTSTFSASIASQPDLVYVLEHSSTVSGEQDTSNSAGIGIWSASNQGLYGVASQDQGEPQALSLSPIDGRGHSGLGASASAPPGYFINMNLGSPATNFKVQLDTSSADTWVASTACTDCGVNYGRRKAIGPSTSASLVANDTAAWTASYSPSYPVSGVDVALASAQGTMAKDLVIFGGGLSMENFPFGLATSVSDTFSASEMCVLLEMLSATVKNSLLMCQRQTFSGRARAGQFPRLS